MRVTFEHREKLAGFAGERRRYFLECLVRFSEEELAIIRERDLWEHYIVLDPAMPPVEFFAYMTAGALQAFSPLIGSAGLAIAVSGLFRNGDLVSLGLFIFVMAPILWGLGYLYDRKYQFQFRNPNQRVSIRIMAAEKFTVFSPNPAYLQVIEEDVKNKLAGLKNVILASAELPDRKSVQI